jgi:protein subunit release factor A
VSERPLHPAFLSDEDLLAQCTIGKGRSGGPGGQNRNKVETKVILTHTPSGIAAQAAERRSAIENRRVALSRLRLALAVQLRTAVPVGDARSERWRSRTTPDGRVVCSARHRDFAALLAEALDMMAACRWDERRAALRLSITVSQLVKLLRSHPEALSLVNRQRAFKGGHTLK